MFYRYIRDEGVLCQVVTNRNSASVAYSDLFSANNDPIIGTGVFLANYSDLTSRVLVSGKIYTYNTSQQQWVQEWSSYTVQSSSPSDYYTDITSGDYTLEAA